MCSNQMCETSTPTVQVMLAQACYAGTRTVRKKQVMVKPDSGRLPVELAGAQLAKANCTKITHSPACTPSRICHHIFRLLGLQLATTILERSALGPAGHKRNTGASEANEHAKQPRAQLLSDECQWNVLCGVCTAPITPWYWYEHGSRRLMAQAGILTSSGK